jgi:hypothetical protein
MIGSEQFGAFPKAIQRRDDRARHELFENLFDVVSVKVGYARSLAEILESPGDVVHVDGDLRGLLDEGEVLQEAVRVQQIDIGLDGRLHHHLVRREHLLRRGLGARGRLGPQQLDVRVEGHTLQTDGEGGDRQDAHEQELAGVRVEDAAQGAQLALNSATNPQNAAVSARFALQQSIPCNGPPKKRPDVTRTTQEAYIWIRQSPPHFTA